MDGEVPPFTQRWAVGVHYAGDAYAGWQKQSGAAHCQTVQGLLEPALSRVANHPVILYAAGRTDKGVHATGQVAHFEAYTHRSPMAWVQGVLSQLPPDIRILWAEAVDPTFHARFSALSRTYCYTVFFGKIQPPLYHNRVWHVASHENWNAGAMRTVAAEWIGEHNFSSFRSTICQSRSPMRRVDQISVMENPPFLHIRITANAFLHHMVRKMVGLLARVGAGRCTPEGARDYWVAENPQVVKEMAPACGLYLEAVDYPEPYRSQFAAAAPFVTHRVGWETSCA